MPSPSFQVARRPSAVRPSAASTVRRLLSGIDEDHRGPGHTVEVTEDLEPALQPRPGAARRGQGSIHVHERGEKRGLGRGVLSPCQLRESRTVCLAGPLRGARAGSS